MLAAGMTTIFTPDGVRQTTLVFSPADGGAVARHHQLSIGSEALHRRIQKRSRRKHSMVRQLLIVTTFCPASPLVAQSPPASSPSAPNTSKQSDAASSPAKSIGMFAYRKRLRNAAYVSVYPRLKFFQQMRFQRIEKSRSGLALACGIQETCLRSLAS
jgi:hypothetical protein